MTNPFAIPAVAADYPLVEDGYRQAVEVAVELAVRHGLPRDAALVDLGAGSGLAAAGLLCRGYANVTLVDPSEAMLDLARSRLGRRARCLAAGVDDLAQHVSGSAQGILAVNSYQYFPAKARALDNVAAALAPQGYFIFNLGMPEYRFADAGEPDLALVRFTLAYLEKLLVLTRLIPVQMAITQLREFLAGTDQRPLVRDDLEAVLAEFGFSVCEVSEYRFSMVREVMVQRLHMLGRSFCENVDLLERIIARLGLPQSLIQPQVFIVARKHARRRSP